MTFLELCKRLRQESGYEGTGPASVENQTGDSLRFVTWIQEADLEIQSLRTDWAFMREPLSIALSSGTATAALPADFNRLDAASLVVKRADGTNTYPDYVQPNVLRMVKREQTDNGGLPLYITMDAGICEVFPTPNEAITVTADYFVQPTKMTTNSAESRLPSEYRLAIVFYALMNHGAYDEASNMWNHAHNRWTQYFNRMNQTQLPELRAGGALA